MPDEKAIIIIEEDGGESYLPPDKFDWDMGRKVVGGYLESVRVLRSDLEGFTFTYILVDGEGKLKKRPANEKATKLYRANIERQYHWADDPFKESVVAFDKSMAEAGIPVHHTATPEERINPQIYGTVIWFKGYTCHEVEEEGLM